MKIYDYIITGSGASGLMLAYRMAKDPYFDDADILLIDKEIKSTNDRTWCFWEESEGEWDDLVCKSWKKIIFKSNTCKKNISLNKYTYKMIRSANFYKHLWDFIKTKKNIVFVQDEVSNISMSNGFANVHCTNNNYKTPQLLNSVDLEKKYTKQSNYPVLLQHFNGWFVETENDAFDDSTATFMDFTVEQKGNTRFMYVLPMTPKVALFEYTLFSETVLSTEAYEKEIKAYLKKKSITSYKIIEKEQGIIPMTSYKFWKDNSKHILHIGTAGGWTKASTGFTFKNTTDKTADLVAFLKTDGDLRSFRKNSRYWWYDLLLLDVLASYNHMGSQLFSKLFEKNSLKTVFEFLDEKTSFLEDLKIMFSMPPHKFVIALIRRIFRLAPNS